MSIGDLIVPLYRGAAIVGGPVTRLRAWRRHEQVAAVVDRLGSDLLVLDVGCGEGPVARQLAPRHRLVGIDPDALALERFARYGLAVVADARALPFDDDVFDVVLCSQSLTCIPVEYDAALAEIARVLRPGGTLIVEQGVLTDVSLWPLLAYWGVRRRLPGRLRLDFPARRTTWRTLRRALQRAGLTSGERFPLEFSVGPITTPHVERLAETIRRDLPSFASQYLVVAEKL